MKKRMNHRKELEKDEYTWGNPDAIERRDRELIEAYLNEAPEEYVNKRRGTNIE